MSGIARTNPTGQKRPKQVVPLKPSPSVQSALQPLLPPVPLSQPASTVTELPLSPPEKRSIYNVPNALTSIRFAMAIAVMTLIPLEYFLSANIVFLVAASTDWMDGYWARKYGQVTKFGRIFDPFVDKIIICGSFIALVGVAESPVYSWMATLVVGRELLVTSLRGMIEGSGKDFSARWLGKWKMVLQCAAVVASLLYLQAGTPATWLVVVTQALLWSSILLTVYSGYEYTHAAAKLMQDGPDDVG